MTAKTLMIGSAEDLARSDSARRELAQLNLLAYPDYYDGLGLEGDTLLALSAAMFGVDGGELTNTIVAASDAGEVLGFAAALPSADFPAAVARTAFEVFKHIDRPQRAKALAHMQAIRAGRDLLPDDSYYLARIAVTPSARGTGLAGSLMDRVEVDAKGRDISLHVSADNERAIHFYRRRQYEVTSRTDQTLLMVKAGRT